MQQNHKFLIQYISMMLLLGLNPAIAETKSTINLRTTKTKIITTQIDALFSQPKSKNKTLKPTVETPKEIDLPPQKQTIDENIMRGFEVKPLVP